MRTKYSIWNIFVSLGTQVINIILQFVCRRVFLIYFSEAYLGVNGLFTEILNIFSLAELGIGTAMMFGLYEAVASQDEDRIRRLMNLYRKMYVLVGIGVLICGMVMFPFLDVFIKDNQIPHIQMIYLMYLMNSVISYFYSYKQTLIQANQKSYIVSALTQGVRCIQIFVQMLVIVAVKSFYLYLGIQIFAQVVTNVVLAVTADRMYPYLKKDKKSLPEKEEQKKIFNHVKAMALHRFGGVFVLNTDNLLISMFVGLGTVGLYSNYKMVINSLKLFATYVYGSFTASVGNLASTESSERTLEAYHSLNFLMSMMYGWMGVCLAVLFNPFIEVMFGQKFVLGMTAVLIIVADFYIHGMRQMTLCFRNAMGLFWHDRYKPLIEVPLNLVISLLLVKEYAISGVLLGTVISTLATSFWVEPYVFFRHGIKEQWKRNLGNYFLRYGIYTAFTIVTGIICVKCTAWLSGGLLILAVKAALITVIYILCVLIIFGRTREVKFIWKRISAYLKR